MKTQKENFDDIKPKGLETIPGKTIKEQLPITLERIKTMGNVSAKETTELLVALGKVATSIKQSVDDDGKITIGDAYKFTDDIIPLFNGVKGINQIPAEFKDGFDEVEKAEMKSELAAVLEIADNDELAVDAGLDVVFALQRFLKVTGIIKSE